MHKNPFDSMREWGGGGISTIELTRTHCFDINDIYDELYEIRHRKQTLSEKNEKCTNIN